MSTTNQTFFSTTELLLLSRAMRGAQQRSLTSSYFRSAVAVIFVYDETDRQTFENLDHWLEDTNRHSTDILSFVIGTKCDLIQSGTPQAVKNEEAEAWAARIGASVMHVSSVTGSGVEEAFSTIFESLLQKFVQDFPQSLCHHLHRHHHHGGLGTWFFHACER